jgi:cAMP-dependent protein kinase regulator
VTKELTNGDYFGELAIIKNQPRAASVKAKVFTTVVCLDKSEFLHLLSTQSHVDFK